MAWQSTPYILLLFVASVIATLCGMYGLSHANQHGKTQYVRAFVILCVGVTVWSTAYAVQLSSTVLGTKLLAYGILHIGVSLVVPAWLLFALAYTGRTAWVTLPVVGGICLIPALFLMGLVTNPSGVALTGVGLETSNGLVVLVTGNGPLYQLFLAYTYVIIPLGGVLIAQQAIKTGLHARKQATLLLAGGLLPLGINIVHVLGVWPLSAVTVNLTPVSIAVSAALIAVGLFKYQLINITPIARNVVFNQMGEGVVVLDANHRIVDSNPAANAMLGLSGSLVGGAAATSIPEYDKFTDTADRQYDCTVEANHERTIQVTRTPIATDYRPDSTGSDKPNSTTGDGSDGWVILLTDITEREQQRIALERKNHRLDTFASVVSHDLRNPLSIIRGHVALAQETGADRHFDVIDSTADRMSTFLDELLTLSREGQTVTEKQPIALSTVIGETLSDTDSHQLTVDIQTDAVVMADRVRLAQIFDNLLRNAVDHSSTDDPSVTDDEHTEAVRVEIGSLPDGFYIEDNGPGVPESVRESLFEYGETSSSGGSGFGLGIVQDIVLGHDWEIQVTDGSTGGARFEITGVEFVTP
jgi:signal transduction histidine kinase